MRRLDAAGLGERDYQQIADVLREGGIVCMPTDTVYGLAADPFNAAAMERLFQLKRRPRSQSVILLVDSIRMAEELAIPSPHFRILAEAFWPGPLTLVLPAGDRIASETVALRWPDAPVVEGVVGALGGPITSTSANRSGEPVATSGEEAARRLRDIDVLIEQGEIGARLPSTLLDLTTHRPHVLREGALSSVAVAGVLEGLGEGAGR